MEDPKLHLGINVNDGRISLTMHRSDGGGRPAWVNWDLREVESGGYLAFCQRIGDIALRMLATAHPAKFAEYPLLMPPKNAADDPYSVVTSLIHRSLRQKTTAYVAAIDAMFIGDADELEKTDLIDHWREVRAELIASYGAKQQ
jgi:hypothetical protein